MLAAGKANTSLTRDAWQPSGPVSMNSAIWARSTASLLELFLGDRRGGYWTRRTSERPGFRIYKNVAQDWIAKNHGRDTLQRVHANIGYHIGRE